jgi:hypothetical protein
MSHLLKRSLEEHMETPGPDDASRLSKSALYREFLAERDEILRYKWIESEKAGYDIGFERALVDWVLKYRSAWRNKQCRQ